MRGHQAVFTAAAGRLLTSAFLAGWILLAFEIVWFRFLSMFVITTTLAASLMLGVGLTAIAVGGLTATRWLRRTERAVEHVPIVALAAACASAAAYALFRFLTTGTQVVEWYRILWFAALLTFGTSLMSGILFTLLGEALKAHFADETEAAGWLLLANTCGAMCGPLVATFLLLPRFGVERTMFALSAAYVAIGLLVLNDTLRTHRPTRAFAVLAIVTIVVLTIFPFGVMSGTYVPRSSSTWMADGSQIVATREGPAETIFLMRQTWQDKAIYYRLVTNGFSMSSTLPTAKRYMRYFVYWPMLLRPTPPRHVLVICYGVGVTAGAVTNAESVESIDVVEISRDIASMSDHIYPPAEHPLRDPRVRLHIEDGRYFLQSTRDRFDLITGEPPPPLAAAAVNLYTREYFQLVYDRLSDGGITTYWLPVARGNEYDVKTIIRGFCDVFDDCSLWNGTIFDWMLVGTRHASGPVGEAELRNRWNTHRVASHLREIGFEQPQQIGASFLGDAAADTSVFRAPGRH